MRHILCVFFSVLYIAQGALLMSAVVELAEWCIELEEVNGNQDDIDDILMGYLPESRTGQCMLRCMQTKVGIIVNDTYSVDGAYKFFRKHFPENPYHKNIERGVRFCGKVVEKRTKPNMHKCQYAHMVGACIRRRIKYTPGCRAAFYRPFVWKNPFRKATVKPAKKYFEVQRMYIPRQEFEIITKAPKKYTLDDVEGASKSEEKKETKPYMYIPPPLRKGKRRRDQLTDKRKGKWKKKSSGESSSDSDELSLDRSTKTRRHQKKWGYRP